MRLVSASPVKVFYSSHHHHPQSVLPECISSEANLEYLIFVSCPGCHRLWMASVPQGAYAAWKVHRSMMKDLSEDCPIMGKKNDSEKSIPSQYHFPQRNKILLDHNPAKYNSKMMNSIWGLYNRYSVHNLKMITDGDEKLGSGVQQQTAVDTPQAIPLSSSLKGGSIKGPQSFATWEVLLCGHTY